MNEFDVEVPLDGFVSLDKILALSRIHSQDKLTRNL